MLIKFKRRSRQLPIKKEKKGFFSPGKLYHWIFIIISSSYCIIVMVSDQQPNRINELNICQWEASGLIKGTAGVFVCVCVFLSFFFFFMVVSVLNCQRDHHTININYQ